MKDLSIRKAGGSRSWNEEETGFGNFLDSGFWD